VSVPVLGIIENMSGFVCPHCGERVDLFNRGGGERLAEEMEVPFLGSIPIEPQIAVSGDAGTPFVQTNQDHPVTDVFQKIIENIIKSIVTNTKV
jgi:ATP-binding protein involved in chromosome partitioning